MKVRKRLPTKCEFAERGPYKVVRAPGSVLIFHRLEQPDVREVLGSPSGSFEDQEIIAVSDRNLDVSDQDTVSPAFHLVECAEMRRQGQYVKPAVLCKQMPLIARAEHGDRRRGARSFAVRAKDPGIQFRQRSKQPGQIV